jgi:DNA-binding PadR family transcriptional regulator
MVYGRLLPCKIPAFDGTLEGMTMYELFVLGELLDQPLHGYLLREIVNLAIGPVRQMSWGGLYPLVRRLETEGLIEQAKDARHSGARERKVYRITPAGQERFLFLMLKPEEYSLDYPDLFNIKLTNFDHLSINQRLDVLRHYQGYVRFILDHLQNGTKHVSSQPRIGEGEREHILRALEHRSAVSNADLAWVEAEILRLGVESPTVIESGKKARASKSN